MLELRSEHQPVTHVCGNSGNNASNSTLERTSARSLLSYLTFLRMAEAALAWNVSARERNRHSMKRNACSSTYALRWNGSTLTYVPPMVR